MGQAARWLDFIEEHDFIIQHRAGIAHGNSDAFCRRPNDRETESNGGDRDVLCQRVREPTVTSDFEEVELSPSMLIEAQEKDPALRLLIDSLKISADRPAWSQVQRLLRKLGYFGLNINH